jgi:hypothetical protein
MVLTRRFKVLVVLAAVIGASVLLSKPDDATAPVGATTDRAERMAAQQRNDATLHAASGHASPDAGGSLARLAHRVTDGKAVDALFHTQSWYVAPPPPPPAPVVVVAPPPPTAPPLPFAVMGSYARPGDAKVYFFTRGDRVFDVHIGDTIDNTYSVDSEANGVLTLTYKPLNIQQTLAVEATK